MDNLIAALEFEIIREQKLIATCQNFLNTAPKGVLTVRPRRRSKTYYWTFEDGNGAARKQKQVNITGNHDLILQLTNKMIFQEILNRCLKNKKLLENLLNKYKPVDPFAVMKSCSPKYKEVFLLRKKQLLEKRLTAPYKKCPYNPKFHVHETDYGELVRSKSEQLLGNTLFAYGIPFHYEEAFECANGVTLFPDFRILLPDNSWKIWEHLGLLSNEDYCSDNAKKLNLFQQNGLVIGGNLILTMDDNKQDFSSGIINQIINNQILPLLHGIRVDKEKIIEGIQQPYMK